MCATSSKQSFHRSLVHILVTSYPWTLQFLVYTWFVKVGSSYQGRPLTVMARITGGKRYPPNMSHRVLRVFPKIFQNYPVPDLLGMYVPNASHNAKLWDPLPKACPKEATIMWMSQAGPNVVSQTLPKDLISQ
jgi:hypothetical protein